MYGASNIRRRFLFALSYEGLAYHTTGGEGVGKKGKGKKNAVVNAEENAVGAGELVIRGRESTRVWGKFLFSTRRVSCSQRT